MVQDITVSQIYTEREEMSQRTGCLTSLAGQMLQLDSNLLAWQLD